MVDLTRGRRAGLLAIVAGLGIAAAAGLAAPLATPPLYDGVVVQPYAYVTPLAGKPGGAQGASAHLAISGHQSPFVALATPEQPPQAQVLAQQGTLVLPPSARALDVSITPLDASVHASAASSGSVLGNVYRITVVDQAGTAVTAPAAALVTVVLRAPEAVADAQVAQLVGGTWHRLKTESGFGSSYVAVVASFGDFAVVGPASSSPTASAASASPSSPGPSATEGVPTQGVPTGSIPPLASTGDSGAGGLDQSSAVQMGAVLLILLIAFVVVAFVVTSVRGRRAGR